MYVVGRLDLVLLPYQAIKLCGYVCVYVCALSVCFLLTVIINIMKNQLLLSYYYYTTKY